jgi:hypothetical protein
LGKVDAVVREWAEGSMTCWMERGKRLGMWMAGCVDGSCWEKGGLMVYRSEREVLGEWAGMAEVRCFFTLQELEESLGAAAEAERNARVSRLSRRSLPLLPGLFLF